MRKTLSVLGSCVSSFADVAALSQAQEVPPAFAGCTGSRGESDPADGHVIHVTAPHLIDGKIRGHFIIIARSSLPSRLSSAFSYETEDNNAKLVGVEYIVAKTVTRDEKVLPRRCGKRFGMIIPWSVL